MNIEKYLVLNKFILSLFGVADYGIVDDFQNVIPILKEKTKGMK